MMKKLLTLFLAVVMVVGMLPMSVSAADDVIEVDSIDDFITKTNPTYNYMHIESGHYKLVADVESSKSLGFPIANSKVTIDLNGHILSFGDYGNHAFSVRGINSEIRIIDSRPNVEHKGYLDENGLWKSGTKDGADTVNLYGGIILGRDFGGYFAFQVREYSKFILDGGTIAGFMCAWGTVYMKGSDAVFNMNGGSIQYNRAQHSDMASYAASSIGSGGGVYVDNEALFIMNGGTIAHNTAR